MPRPRLAARAVLAALTAVAGCRTAPRADEGGTLRLAVAADVTGFFPDMSNETYSQDVNGSIFEGLSGFDAQLRVRPLLAARWQNPDQRTYIFDIRPGARFSDGRPLTADDVVASLEAHLARRWVYADYLQAVESVRAVGPQRVEIRTRFPYLLLLYKLPYGLVVPKQAVADRASTAIGTGPYRLESWRRGQDFVLARNEHYWGQRARFARAHFVVEPDSAPRLRLLESGATDVAEAVPLETLTELERRTDIRVDAGPGNRVLFLGLRLSTAPFSDPRVREAVELALDRAELIDRALSGRGTPASQLVPPAVVGFDPRLAVVRTDRARARQLLASAG